jgi:superfamily II DNA or RNA helicase
MLRCSLRFLPNEIGASALRPEGVSRAEQVFKLYEGFSEFNPVQLHTGIKSLKKRDIIRRDIMSGKSRIVVCVDMLGEGFDLPELKIAAFHDIRKILAVTLQLAGRFMRARSAPGCRYLHMAWDWTGMFSMGPCDSTSLALKRSSPER